MTSAPPSKDINGVTANDILLLRSRIEYLESQNTSVKKICTELRKQIDELIQAQSNKKESVDLNMFKDLEEEVNNLKQAMMKLQDEYSSNFKNLQDQINKKADKEQLLELEARIMEKLNDMLKRLLGNFADRNDTLKRLASLEKNVSFYIYPMPKHRSKASLKP